MLASRHFYSEHAYRQRVKSPVEYVLGAVLAVYRRYDEKEANYQPLPQQGLVSWLNGMGQHLFAPPNVKGWPGGRAWLTTDTMLQRDNFATALAMGTLFPSLQPKPAVKRAAAPPPRGKAGVKPAPPDALDNESDAPAPPKAIDPARLLEEEGVQRPEDVVRALLDLYVPGGVRSEVKAKLVSFVAEGKPTGTALDQRVREAVHAILTMPEFHLA
jgi:hypothetical protein